MATESFLLASLMVCGTCAMYPVIGMDPLRDAAQDDWADRCSQPDADMDEAVCRAILLAVTI